MWPFKKSIETKSCQPLTQSFYIDDINSSFLACSLLNQVITPQKAFAFYRQNSSVATAVDMRAEAFAQIKPIIELADGSILDKHPALDLLQYPNEDMVWSDFAGRIARHYDLTGTTHFYGLGVNTMPPQEIYPVKPIGVSNETKGEYVRVYHVGFGVATGTYFRETAKQRIARFYDKTGLQELYRIAGFSSMTTDGNADSPLQAAALETNQQIKGRIHNTSVLDNGARLSLMVVFKDRMDDNKHKETVKRLNETIGGSENTGKILVAAGGDLQEVKEMGLSPKDMDFSNLDSVAGQAIYKRYSIPLSMIYTDATTMNNMENGVKQFYDFAALPLTDKLLAGLTRFLLPRFNIPLGSARITYNPDSIQALKDRRLEELSKRKTIGVETINELREALPNREAIEGGDDLYQLASLVKLGTDPLEDEPRTVQDDTN